MEARIITLCNQCVELSNNGVRAKCLKSQKIMSTWTAATFFAGSKAVPIPVWCPLDRAPQGEER